MVKTQKISIDITEEILRICDCCGREMEMGSPEEEESFSIDNVSCGYSSVFGDGSKISLDLCQYCAKELLGQYIRVTNE